MYVGPLAVVLTPHGHVPEDAYADKSYLARSPLLWDWRTSGNTVWVTRDVLNEGELSPPECQDANESLELDYILTEFQTYQTTLSDLSNSVTDVGIVNDDHDGAIRVVPLDAYGGYGGGTHLAFVGTKNRGSRGFASGICGGM